MRGLKPVGSVSRIKKSVRNMFACSVHMILYVFDVFSHVKTVARMTRILARSLGRPCQNWPARVVILKMK